MHIVIEKNNEGTKLYLVVEGTKEQIELVAKTLITLFNVEEKEDK